MVPQCATLVKTYAVKLTGGVCRSRSSRKEASTVGGVEKNIREPSMKRIESSLNIGVARGGMQRMQ